MILPTLKIKMQGPKGLVNICTIIDTSSHRSYILEKIARKFRCETESEQTMVHSLFGGTKTTATETQNLSGLHWQLRWNI